MVYRVLILKYLGLITGEIPMNRLYVLPIVGLLFSNFTLAKGNDFVGSYISETEGGIERLAF